jgi:hypothetical protein
MAADDDAAAAAAAAAQKEAEDKAREDAARRAEAARLRAEALDKFEAAHEAIWAQATAVVNVKAMIPILLDKATGTYTKWRGMFLTVLGKYALTPHVLNDEALPDRPVWVQVDCVVLSWIFTTVSGDLQQSLMTRQRNACEAWCYLEEEFLGQKESRALLLETQFRNLRQDSMTITDYCRKLETMASSLAEFGDPVGDRQMVLTLLRGLNGKFRHMVTILKLHRPFPTFAEARTHLLLEEVDIDARPPSPPPALLTTAPPAPARQGTLCLLLPRAQASRAPLRAASLVANVTAAGAAREAAPRTKARALRAQARATVVAIFTVATFLQVEVTPCKALADRAVVIRVVCIPLSHTPGPASSRCGPTAARRPRRRPSTLLHSMASAGLPAAATAPTVVEASTTPAPPIATMEARPMEVGCPRHRPFRARCRPGTLLMAALGIRTRWHKTSAP